MGIFLDKIEHLLKSLGTNNSAQFVAAVLAGFKMVFIPLATLRDKNATPEQKRYTMTRDVITEALAFGTYLGVTGQVQKHGTAPLCSMYYKSKAKLIRENKIKPLTPLTKDELNFLENVDYKKIKEAGEDFLTKTSSKHKVMSKETAQYIEDLKKIIEKIQGPFKVKGSVPIDSFVKDMNKNGIPKENRGLSVLIEEIKASVKDSPKISDPVKLFQNTRMGISQFCVLALAMVIIPWGCNIILTPVMKRVKNKFGTEEKTPLSKTDSFAGYGNIDKPKPVNTLNKRAYYSDSMIPLGNMRV